MLEEKIQVQENHTEHDAIYVKINTTQYHTLLIDNSKKYKNMQRYNKQHT